MITEVVLLQYAIKVVNLEWFYYLQSVSRIHYKCTIDSLSNHFLRQSTINSFWLRECTLNPITVSGINFEFTKHSRIYYKTNISVVNSLDICFANLYSLFIPFLLQDFSQIHYLLREGSMNSLSISQIHYELTFCFTNSH